MAAGDTMNPRSTLYKKKRTVHDTERFVRLSVQSVRLAHATTTVPHVADRIAMFSPETYLHMRLLCNLELPAAKKQHGSL